MQEVLIAEANNILRAPAGWNHAELALVSAEVVLEVSITHRRLSSIGTTLIVTISCATKQIQPTQTLWNILHWVANENYVRLGSLLCPLCAVGKCNACGALACPRAAAVRDQLHCMEVRVGLCVGGRHIFLTSPLVWVRA